MMIANLGHYRLKALILLSGVVLALQAQGQSSPESNPAPVPMPVAAQPEAQSKQLTNYVETGADYMTLTNGFGSWSGGYTRPPSTV